MTEYQITELTSRIELATSNALDAAKGQNWQAFDQHMEKISDLRASLPVNDARTIGTAILKDTMEKRDAIKIRVGVEKDNLGLEIHPEGTGTYDGPYAPILLEQHEGMMRLFVWADINEQEPTAIIDLSDALETNRTDTD